MQDTAIQYPRVKNSPPIDTEAFTRSSVVMTLAIPANGMASIPSYGESFYLIGCSAPVEIKTDATAFKPYRKGTGEDFPPELRFKRLEVRNRNSSLINIQIWVGFGNYRDNRFEVIDEYAETIGDATPSIPAVTTRVFDGVTPAGYIQRKAFVISNLDPNSTLHLLDENDNFICAVFPETSIMLPTAGVVKVQNQTAIAITTYIGQIWYKENAI